MKYVNLKFLLLQDKDNFLHARGKEEINLFVETENQTPSQR